MNTSKKYQIAQSALNLSNAAKQHRAAGRIQSASNMEAEAQRLTDSLPSGAGQQWLQQELQSNQEVFEDLFGLL